MWRQVGAFLGNNPVYVAILVLCSVLAGLCESAVLTILAQAATALVNRGRTITMSLGPIHLHSNTQQLLIIGLAISVLRIALQGPLAYLPARICAGIQVAMRRDLFASFSMAGWSAVSVDEEGTFQELATNQVWQATAATLQATGALTTGTMLLVLVISAFLIGAIPATIVIGTGVVLFLALRPINRLGARRAKSFSAAQMDLAAGIYDAVNTAEESRVFGAGQAQAQSINGLIDAAASRLFSTQFISRLVSGGYQAVIFLLLLASLAIVEAAGAASHIASLGAVVLILVRASNYGQQAQSSYTIMHQTKPFIDRIQTAVQRYRQSCLPRGSGSLDGVPTLDFRAVSFSYQPGIPVLQNLTFTVDPGEVVGVVGPTGAGKSTLVQILLGLREAGGGAYLVAGEPSRHWSAESWTGHIAYVPQEPRLISGTVADNIRFFRSIDDDAIARAAQQAHIHEDIVNWPLGYATPISQRAKAVSGGQRQRICLARALAGKPSILVLDEPTSALDPRSESLIQGSLGEIKGQLTLIVIAHRLSILTICDRIMVLESGRLDAFGSAGEIVQSNEFYRNAAEISRATALATGAAER